MSNHKGELPKDPVEREAYLKREREFKAYLKREREFIQKYIEKHQNKPRIPAWVEEMAKAEKGYLK